MTATQTPSSKSQRLDQAPSLADDPPPTPKLPFDPPKRRSSLAFSRMLESPTTDNNDHSRQLVEFDQGDQLRTQRSNISRKRALETPLKYPCASLGSDAQVEKIFQAARANLHLDMHFAASPIGSIDSRLPRQDNDQAGDDPRDVRAGKSMAPWRYSTVPELFSAAVSDVREPLPYDSPTLPTLCPQGYDHALPPIEPTSSGFASPLEPGKLSNAYDQALLPRLPGSGPAPQDRGYRDSNDSGDDFDVTAEDVSELTHPMTELKVGSDEKLGEERFDDLMDDSPIVDHLRRRSCHSPSLSQRLLPSTSGIFLSQPAKAAAESAKAKREVLKQISDNIENKENVCPNSRGSNSKACDGVKASCPDPELHHYLATTPCPDPLAHFAISTPEAYQRNIAVHKTQPHLWANERFVPGGIPARHGTSRVIGQRTTASGSPMPFVRRTRNQHIDGDHDQMHPVLLNTSPEPTMPFSYHSHSKPRPTYPPHHGQKPSEHFRPGWYYAGASSGGPDRPTQNLYSFSTAAAKRSGESVAPDSRIRNSYRTDTLTPLARPQGRFRRNGLTAALRLPATERYHTHASPTYSPRRPPPHGARILKPAQFRDTQVRSSPPRPSHRVESHRPVRKRDASASGLSDVETTEDNLVESAWPPLRSQISNDLIQVDESTRAAVRMSLFGGNLPECLQSSTAGIRELSPNINIWRKGMAGGPHYRKKRRPSYWDGDLEEVRNSPAGRGGIESSPVMSKKSMIAELDNATSYFASSVGDAHGPADKYSGITSENDLENEPMEVIMTDVEGLHS